MAATKVLGYELSLKWGTKLIMGLETAGLKIKPNFETLLLKENQGEAVEELVDFDTTFSFGGKTFTLETGEGTTHEDFQSLRAAAAAGASVAFVYGRFVVGKKIVTGTGVLTDFSEDANSKDIATFSGSIVADKGSVEFDVYSES
jgi:hypothetical protein